HVSVRGGQCSGASVSVCGLFSFFFQAEDGIRDFHVTGVQTCALPISEDAIIVRGARMLATLAPFADELAVYPGSDIRVEDKKYALCFSIPMNTPGLKFICRDSYTKNRSRFDYPLSSRFDEMDAVVIFDDVYVPKDRVFLDGDPIGYTEVIRDTHWRAYIIFQAMTRALTKLEFAFGLGHLISEMTGV